MLTSTQQVAYINALRNIGLEAKSANAAGTTLRAVRKTMESDPEFANMCLDTLEEFNDLIEQEAMRRAVEGVPEPVFHKGEIVGHITKYSDTLLTKLLTGRRPDVYGDKKQIIGANNGPVVIEVRDFTTPTRIDHVSAPTAQIAVQNTIDQITLEIPEFL